MSLPVLDLVVMITYLVVIVYMGVFYSRKFRNTTSGYFLAGRSLTWPVVGAALFSSNISTIHLVGLTASGYNEGLAWGNYEWMAVFVLILLSLVFAPFYFKSRISTLPEYLEKRYDGRSRTFLAFLGIVGAVFMHIGLSLYAGAVVFKQFFDIDIGISIVVISVITGFYTVLGGLKAVVVTETVQSVLLLSGSILVTALALNALDGHGISSYSDFMERIKPNQMSMIQIDDSNGLAWYGVLLGSPILGIWYWCTDQTLVQRVLGAKTLYDAQMGPLFAGFLKLFTVLFMVFPGVLAYVLFSDEVGADANQALPVLIGELVPTGLMGLISAGLLAALMSSIAAALHSISTLVSLDIADRLVPNLSEKQLLVIGRVSAVLVLILAMLWSTQGEKFSSIFQAVATIAACLAPPVTTVFIWGVFWSRGTATASIYTLLSGFLLGVIIFLFELPVFGDQRFFSDTMGIGTLMQAWWSFVVCSLLFVVVSYLSIPKDRQMLNNLIYSTTAYRSGQLNERRYKPLTIAVCLVCLVVILYSVFW